MGGKGMSGKGTRREGEGWEGDKEGKEQVRRVDGKTHSMKEVNKG